MSSLVATLRIAARQARRARGRSALVVAMIALPVTGVTAIDVAVRTFQLSPVQEADRVLGAADLSVADTLQPSYEQYSGADGLFNTIAFGATGRPPVELQPLLPGGSRTIVQRSSFGQADTGQSTVRDLRLTELAYDDPIAAGLWTQTSGRAPRAAGEVVLSDALAERLSLSAGDEVQLSAQAPEVTDLAVTVVGTVASGSSTTELEVLGDPGLVDEAAWEAAIGRGADERLLVDTPEPPTWALVEQLNAEGVVVGIRPDAPGTPPVPTFELVDDEVVTALALVVGMALLEVVLLAGPAFAVGAKRASRDLALLTATGGEPRDVRRVVLGGGLVLGAVAAAVGVGLGLLLARLGTPLLTRLGGGTLPGPFDVRPLEVLAIAAVGVGTALLAAVLPARQAARQDVVAALTGRRGALRSSPLVPVLGIAFAALGAVIALYGASQRDINVVLAGSIVAELGLVATTPALVGLAGRLGPLLPAAPRLALRDAARNRSRTAPAVAAVLAAVAGSVAIGTYVASQDARDERQYQPLATSGSVVVFAGGLGEAARVDALGEALRATLPVDAVSAVSSLQPRGDGFLDVGYVEVAVPVARVCPPYETQAQYDADTRCTDQFVGAGAFGGQPLLGDGETLAALTGVDDPDLRAALDGGTAVVPARHVEGGTATIRVFEPYDEVTRTQASSEVVVPAVALPADRLQVAVFPSGTAELVDTGVVPMGLVATTTRVPTAQEQDRATAALAAVQDSSSVYVERGYVSDYGIGLLALAGGSALLVLGASGIATGLAAADGRADLGTLAAVGASPGLRRRLAAWQSYVTAGLGTVLGVVAGLVPAVGLIRAINASGSDFPLVLPWQNLAITLLAVPVLAALAAAALTRSRLPIVRRAA